MVAGFSAWRAIRRTMGRRPLATMTRVTAAAACAGAGVAGTRSEALRSSWLWCRGRRPQASIRQRKRRQVGGASSPRRCRALSLRSCGTRPTRLGGSSSLGLSAWPCSSSSPSSPASPPPLRALAKAPGRVLPQHCPSGRGRRGRHVSHLCWRRALQLSPATARRFGSRPPTSSTPCGAPALPQRPSPLARRCGCQRRPRG
mmetsp:Transcript_14893/g.52244  ORF Transcript_14893/g.52244 Transcript_14893/m.52244 type:complete len:201 (-) Transcript_14893:846-1448(-)